MNLFRLVLASSLLLLAGCTQPANQEDTRQKAADATAQLKRDGEKASVQLKEGARQASKELKAIGEGVKEGWNQDKNAVDVNTATRAQLSALPSLSRETANRVVAHRPYAEKHDLVTKGVLSEDQYARLETKITVK